MPTTFITTFIDKFKFTLSHERLYNICILYTFFNILFILFDLFSFLCILTAQV